MAVAFLKEAKPRLSGLPGELLDEAAAHYGVVCDHVRALRELHPEREEPDWGPDSTFSSPEAAAIVRLAAAADAAGLARLQQIVDLL